ncbi:MAG: hypothetical protein B7Z47_02065 [Chthoniobacter sp. 12-60-6]|nr:MAG: hypothetical protein B7Z47_02065 [Chthoniobacter sp. 12-60-6]
MSFFDVVIDGIAQTLWLRPRSTPALHEDINLGGLLFEYDGSTDSKKNTASVLSGSPAWNLGLRTGDEIIEVDGKQPDPYDVDQEYQIDVKQRLSHGQAIQLKVRREHQTFEIWQKSKSPLKP